jgi:hypothetical protein
MVLIGILRSALAPAVCFTAGRLSRSGAAWFGSALLIVALALCTSPDDVLAQTTVPNVAPPLTGLSTPLTSTTTNCMMSCNSQVANCRTTCVIPAITSGTTTTNATGSTSC